MAEETKPVEVPKEETPVTITEAAPVVATETPAVEATEAAPVAGMSRSDLLGWVRSGPQRQHPVNVSKLTLFST